MREILARVGSFDGCYMFDQRRPPRLHKITPKPCLIWCPKPQNVLFCETKFLLFDWPKERCNQ